MANSNVNRNITLAGTSIAIFTFLLFFLYPRYTASEVDPILFQLTIAVIVSVIFALVISGLYFYAHALTLSHAQEGTAYRLGRADGIWLLGYTLLLLEPCLILFTINLVVVGFYSLVLWLSYLGVTALLYRKVQAKK